MFVTASFLASVPTVWPIRCWNLNCYLCHSAAELGYCFDFTQAKPVGWSNPLKNLLGPLSEVPISAPPSDWPGTRHRGKEGSRTQLIVSPEKEASGPCSRECPSVCSPQGQCLPNLCRLLLLLICICALTPVHLVCHIGHVLAVCVFIVEDHITVPITYWSTIWNQININCLS